MNGFYVREIQKDEYEELLRLYYEFYKELRSKQGWKPHSIDEYRVDVARIMEKDKVFVAVSKDERIVGFIRVSTREGSYWFEEIYVLPEYRGRGLGRMLVENAEEYVRKNDLFVYIMVLPQHTEAIRFWLKMNYRILNTIELAKNLASYMPSKTRPFIFLQYYFEIYRWEKEDLSSLELRFLELVREFRDRGGSGEELLRLFVDCLEEYIGGISRSVNSPVNNDG